MNWLITGGCGFLGTRLIQYLVQQNNHSIRIIDNLAVGSREDLAQVSEYKEVSADALVTPADGVELIVGDIKDAELALQPARLQHRAGPVPEFRKLCQSGNAIRKGRADPSTD